MPLLADKLNHRGMLSQCAPGAKSEMEGGDFLRPTQTVRWLVRVEIGKHSKKTEHPLHHIKFQLFDH